MKNLNKIIIHGIYVYDKKRKEKKMFLRRPSGGGWLVLYIKLLPNLFCLSLATSPGENISMTRYMVFRQNCVFPKHFPCLAMSQTKSGALSSNVVPFPVACCYSRGIVFSICWCC